MDPEGVLTIFDSCWFESKVFQNHQNPSSSNSESIPDHEIPEKSPTEGKISRLPTFRQRSKSSESNFDVKTLSTDSTIFSPKLQTILSGKESFVAKTEHTHSVSTSKKAVQNRGLRKKKGRLSKSLSDLEFEELKGFMDLGFVFSEEDKFSSLGSTIPGLQRLGKKIENDYEKSIVVYKPPISRPYLSEAWQVMEKMEKVKPLMKWKVTSLSNEIGMKHSLKSWAHSVASAVK